MLEFRVQGLGVMLKVLALGSHIPLQQSSRKLFSMARRRSESRSKRLNKGQKQHKKDTSKTVHFTLLAYTTYTWLKRVYLS